MISNAGYLGIHLDPMTQEWLPTPDCPIGLLSIQGFCEEVEKGVPKIPDNGNTNKGGETYSSSVGKRPVNWYKEIEWR